MTKQHETQLAGLFVGPRQVLMRFKEIAPDVQVYVLPKEQRLCVLPLGDDLHDAMLKIFGTGDWLKKGPSLSTGDMAVAARLSKGASLAYLEIGPQIGEGYDQSAVAWSDGTLTTKPLQLSANDAARRPRSLWPINIALKQLGTKANPGSDEAQTLGLYELVTADDIASFAVPIT